MSDINLSRFRELAKKKSIDAGIDGIIGRKITYMDKVKVVEEKDGFLTCEFILSNGNIDRDFDIVNPEGWDLSEFRKNPVVLWSHEMDELPVAKSISEYVENGQLIGKAQFANRELSERGYMIGQMYKHGFLNAVSCGFRGTEWTFSEEPDRPWGINFEKQILWEYSCCTVPANPDALVKAKAAGIDTNAALKMAEEALSGSGLIDLISKDTAEKIYAALRADKAFVDMKSTSDEDMARMQMQLKFNQNVQEVM